MESIKQYWLDISNFGLLSLRSGGITEARANILPVRLLKMHGGWIDVGHFQRWTYIGIHA